MAANSIAITINERTSGDGNFGMAEVNVTISFTSAPFTVIVPDDGEAM
jgi:hypothetical protein